MAPILQDQHHKMDAIFEQKSKTKDGQLLVHIFITKSTLPVCTTFFPSS
jgi:hypothetical protein